MIKITGRTADLGGGMKVQRVLPFRTKQMVGPFIFLDHFGPADVPSGRHADVRPHPHIGLSTLTYLFEGKTIHRDNLGNTQIIEPGAVNLMTAGSGIVHSERTHELHSGPTYRMHGLQFWLALPDELEDCPPAFFHYPQKNIPHIKQDNYQADIVVGSAFGLDSPVKTPTPTVLVNVKTNSDWSDFLNIKAEELGVYVLEGTVISNDAVFQKNDILIFENSEDRKITAHPGSHFIIIGGSVLPQKKNIWWNFVSSSKQKIEDAKRRWKNQDYPPIEGESEFIPLPEIY